MKSHNRYTGIDPYAIKCIRYNALKLARGRYFFPDELEDIEQELMIDLLLKLPSYNPTKSSKHTFINTVVKNYAVDLIRNITLQKSNGGIKLYSLYNCVGKTEEYEDVLLIDTLPNGANFYGFHDIQCEIDVETTIDVQKIVQRMPATLGDLCALLQSMTITEISQITGIAYWVIYKQVNRIRKAFISAGIKKIT